MASKKPRLTIKEERFVDEYLIDRIGTTAYLRANPGVARTTAATESSKLLGKPKVKEAIAIASKDLQRQFNTNAKKEIQKLTMLAEYDIGRAFDLTKEDWIPLPPRLIPYEIRKCIVGVKITRRCILGADGKESVVVEHVDLKFVDKLAARDKLLRHFGLYKDPVPLEVLLGLLPAELRDQLRASLGASVLEGTSPASPLPTDAPGKPPGSLPGGRSLADLPVGGVDPRPLADGLPERSSEASPDALLPPSREEPGERGEDTDALFE